MRYFAEALTDGEQESWRAANLDAAEDPTSLRADFKTKQNH